MTWRTAIDTLLGKPAPALPEAPGRQHRIADDGPTLAELQAMGPAEVARAVGVTRQAGHQRIARARESGRWDLLLAPATTTGAAGAEPKKDDDMKDDTKAPAPSALTSAVQQLLAAAADPTRRQELDAQLVSPALAEAMQQASSLDSELHRLRARHDEQLGAVAEAAIKCKEAKAAADEAVAAQAIAIDQAEITTAAAAVKSATAAERRAAEAHTAAVRLQDALRLRIEALEPEQRAARDRLAQLLTQHRGALAELVEEELRARLQELAPLLRLISALATGAGHHGMARSLDEVRVPNLVGVTGALLSGTRLQTGEMVPAPGTTLTFPASVDLVGDWRSDPALQAIADAAGAPLQLERRLGSYVSLAQVEAERTRAEAYASRPRPSSVHRTMPPAPTVRAPAAPPPAGSAFQPASYRGIA